MAGPGPVRDKVNRLIETNALGVTSICRHGVSPRLKVPTLTSLTRASSASFRIVVVAEPSHVREVRAARPSSSSGIEASPSSSSLFVDLLSKRLAAEVLGVIGASPSKSKRSLVGLSLSNPSRRHFRAGIQAEILGERDNGAMLSIDHDDVLAPVPA